MVRAYEEASTMPGTLLPNEVLTDLRYMSWRILAEVLQQDGRVLLFDNGARTAVYDIDHSIGATVMGLLIGRELLPREDLEELAAGLFLQDIGKLALPPRLVRKNGPLDTGEWELMMQHPLLGLAFLRDDFIPPRAKAVIRSHHERWNGSGYPSGLIGEEIPLFARIAAVADAYDAVTNERHHSTAVSPDEAVELIAGQAGTSFDPRVVETFLEAIDR
jgi:HD-GYP domain-containing protein (c-di-GMP phosphodiesterase class II)